MKKVLGFLMIMAMVSSNAFAANYAYVDLMKLFNDYKKTVKFDEELATKQAEKEEALQKKNEKIVEMQEGLKLLSDDAKAEKEKEIAKLGGELQAEYQESLNGLKTERDEKMKEVLEDIEAEIAEYSKANKIDFMFKKAAIAYADEANDKTNDVLKILNK